MIKILFICHGNWGGKTVEELDLLGGQEWVTENNIAR